MAGVGASDVERAVFGTSDLAAIHELLQGFVRTRLRADIEGVLFRAGRIDAVWAVRLTDGRSAVLKAHRLPIELTELHAVARAQQRLSLAGYPCPTPLTEPDRIHGVVITAESMVRMATAAGADSRRVLATELSRQVQLLSDDIELVHLAGRGSAWCRYEAGPWPTPHDPIFDFHVTPSGFDWLDAVAAEASRQLVAAVDLPTAVGHDDWCFGNVRIDNGSLVASFDWRLVAAPEPFIAGFAAAGYTDGGTDEIGAPSPDDVAAFLADYDSVGVQQFDPGSQRQAAAAATWVMAYNARCQLAMLGDGVPAEASALARLRDDSDGYLSVRW